MLINEIVDWEPVDSSALQALGKEEVDAILPQDITIQDEDGNTFVWKGRQWIDKRYGSRIAKRDKQKELTKKATRENPIGDVYAKFHWRDAEYYYKGVPLDVAKAWQQAESKGKFLNRAIKPFYDYVRIK